jgi:DNA-binding MarR family transcriptional regulator
VVALVRRETDGRLALTAAGETGWARVADQVRTVRAATVDGITERDYAETIRLLSRMVDNLLRLGGRPANA